MECNPSQIQLLFNVIAITAITSLALFCVLLKRDKNKLISELNLRSYQERNQPGVSTLKEGPPPNLESPPEPARAAASDASAAANQDIREYVARRVDSWIARS